MISAFGNLLRELRLRGMRAAAEASFAVIYKGHSVAEYLAGLLVEDALLVELKCAERLASRHTAQCRNYPRASDAPQTPPPVTHD